MKEGCRFPRRFMGAGCAYLLGFCTAIESTAQPLTIIAGPITNPANAHIYYLLAPTNWIGASFNAQLAGGRLVTINDAAENTWVYNTFANYDGVPRNLWLGLKDSGQEGTWVWDNGDPSIYRNWAPSEPDNGGVGGDEDYAVMRGPALPSPGTWSDVAGDATNAPVIEKLPPVPPEGESPTITLQPQSWTVPVSANVAFLVSATGTAPLNYQWRTNGIDLGGATNSSLTLSNVQVSHAGIYSVVVSNSLGVAISSGAALTVFTPSTNCVAHPAGLVAWWRGEGNANDSAGTNHGYPGGVYAPGQVGQAFDFNYNVMLIPGSADFLLTNSFAVEGWVYARRATNGVIFSLGREIELTMEPSAGNISFQIGPPWGPSVSLEATIQTNQWHHIAATFESTSALMTLYIDGAARAQTNTMISPFAGPYSWLWMGGTTIFGGVVVSPFYGLIDELSVYSRALSSNEVQAIYGAGSGGKCAISPATLGDASLVCEPGANKTLRMGGMAGNTYLIQASTNLLEWQDLGDSVADTNGVCEFQDLNSLLFPYRYYRVLTQ
jgi:hypothetical protein